MPEAESIAPRALSYRAHAAATLRLGLPLVGAQLAQISISTIATVMIGWLGANQLAAGVLGVQSYFVLLMLGSGFAFAVMPIVAQARGKDDVRAMRRATRMSFWLTTLYAALMMAPLWYLESILLALGQSPELAAMAGDYSRVLQWSLFPGLYSFVLRSFLAALEHTRIILLATLLAAITSAFLNYALIFGNWGAPALGLRGAALAGVIATFASFALMLGYCVTNPALRRFELMVRVWRPDWSAFRELFHLGWPMSLTTIAEIGLFTATSIMMGWVGEVELAAHGIALQLTAVVFMIPLGLGAAGTIRIGNAFGRGDFVNLRRAAVTASTIGSVVALCAALLFLAFPAQLVRLFLDQDNLAAGELLSHAVALLAVAAGFQLFDALQVIAAGLLRGLKDIFVPMVYAVISYWGIGMPAAYWFAFKLGYGGIGIWLGLALGLALAAASLTFRFFTRVARLS